MQREMLPLRRNEIDADKQVTWKIWKNRQIEFVRKGENKTSTQMVKETEQATNETLDNIGNLTNK